MECARCTAENRAGRRFCGKCGAPLPLPCAACGFANQPGEDFCGGCGRALGAERAERRQLTVMFCDLVDSTALAHKLDPEDLRELIRAYQRCATEVIARFQGYIARYMGDGMLVYFGYPHAQEDAPARAVDSALGIVEALAQLPAPMAVRIGIATGRVVVGDIIGQGASEEAAVIGETPNLAARLQALAEPGSVLIAESTRELAGGLFEYADAGERDIKGLSQPVRTYRALRRSSVESRFDARSSRRTPLIGRERELDQLTQLWRAGVAGNGSVAFLVGEAGIGKSRLAEALAERIAGEPHIRLRYQCSPYHTNSALYPFIHQIEKDAQFLRSDSVAQKLDKLEALLAKSSGNVAEAAPLYAALLSLPAAERYPPLAMTPQQQKAKTLNALLDRLGKLAAIAPVLFVFEDVHWIDPTSMEMLGLGARRIRNIRAFAILTSRNPPDYPWLSLPHVRQIPLERLDRRQSAMMVGRVLEGRAIPAEVLVQIVDRTDGVPLFIEEVTRTLAASPAEVPATLQDSLMARLDQLGSAKEVAQCAAVIGREFSRELLQAISPLDGEDLDGALDRLAASAVLFGRGEPPFASYAFKHALMEDAAYASLLRSRRHALHARVAEALEKLHPERVRTEPELLAHHYTQAGRPLQAAGYWSAAATRALDRSANQEALGHATKGLEVLAAAASGAPAARLELELEILRGTALRALRGFAASETERSFERARELCLALEDVPRLIEARRGLFSCYYARGALGLARAEAQQVAALGETTGDRGSRMLGQWMAGCVAFWQGDFAAARRELEQAVALYDPEAQRANALALQIDPGVNALLHLGWALWILGYPDQAVATSARAIENARRLSQPFALAMSLFFGCATRACCGQASAVRPLLDELIVLAGQHGLGYLGSCALVLEGQELIARGECAAGLEHIGRAFAEFKAQEAGVGLPWAMSISVLAYAKLGKPKEGLAVLARAQQAARRHGERHWEAELLRLQGELLLLPQADEAQAAASFGAAIDLAREQGARSFELRATSSLARLLSRRGEREAAHRMLSQVYAGFTEGFNTADLRSAASLLREFAPQHERSP